MRWRLKWREGGSYTSQAWVKRREADGHKKVHKEEGESTGEQLTVSLVP